MMETVLVGDCLEELRGMGDGSVDAVVTDPPAGIGFMNAEWDKDKGGRAEWIAWLASVMRECLRVLKPGGHALVWALPRTSHWTGMALEDAGFEVRECIVHVFGSGFPKSLDVSKAITAHQTTGKSSRTANRRAMTGDDSRSTSFGSAGSETSMLTARSSPPPKANLTDDARQWEGWGTALKPASEHWWLVRKPLAGTVVGNVLEYGTGALNVDACRVGVEVLPATRRGVSRIGTFEGADGNVTPERTGRWPPNFLLSHSEDCGEACADSCPVAEMDRQSGISKSIRSTGRNGTNAPGASYQLAERKEDLPRGHDDSGGASRFFPVFRYQAKPSRSEKEKGCEGIEARHPTVKPVALMEWLIKLVTPPGGTVLDPFMGSGTTGVAAKRLGFSFIGIEREAEYAAIAKARLAAEKPVKVQGTLF